MTVTCEVLIYRQIRGIQKLTEILFTLYHLYYVLLIHMLLHTITISFIS